MPYVYAACPVCVTIFSTGGNFWPVSNFTELHALTPAACSYALLSQNMASSGCETEYNQASAEAGSY